MIEIPEPMQLWKLYQECGDVHAVGRIVGASGETVRQRLKKAGCRLNGSKWDDAEKGRLRDYYANTPPKDFSLDCIAASLSRSHASVALMASRMGLGNFERPKKAKPQKPTPILPWGKWTRFQHPKGMTGKKHTPEVIAAVGDASRKSWQRMKATRTGNMAAAKLQASSDRMLAMNHEWIKQGKNCYSRTKSGRRADLDNRFFRSAWEANYARYLKWQESRGEIAKWDFECETFWFEKIRRGVRSYLPDFKVWPINGGDPYFVEVKGWMDAKSKTKLKRMKKYHPHVRIELMDAKRYKAMAAMAAAIIPHWEK